MPAGGDKTADRARDCIPCQLGKQDVEEEREGKQQQTSLSLSLSTTLQHSCWVREQETTQLVYVYVQQC